MNDAARQRPWRPGGGWERQRQPPRRAHGEIGERLRLHRIRAPSQIVGGSDRHPQHLAQHPHQGGVARAAAADDGAFWTLRQKRERFGYRMRGEGGERCGCMLRRQCGDRRARERGRRRLCRPMRRYPSRLFSWRPPGEAMHSHARYMQSVLTRPMWLFGDRGGYIPNPPFIVPPQRPKMGACQVTLL